MPPDTAARYHHAARHGGAGAAGRAAGRAGNDSVRPRGTDQERFPTAEVLRAQERPAGEPGAAAARGEDGTRSTRPTIQQGLAHVVEHMAFNGSEHFKPGELISYFESTGARLGPHVNAQTGFETRSTCSICRRTSRRSWRRGSTAFADFAGGLSLETEGDRQGARRRHRGVARRLGAGSRIRDKQIPSSSTSRATRSGCRSASPRVLRSFPPARLRAFYDTFYRPTNMAVVAVGDMDEAEARGAREDRLRRLEGARRGPGRSPGHGSTARGNPRQHRHRLRDHPVVGVADSQASARGQPTR
jgi:hypothetical protein